MERAKKHCNSPLTRSRSGNGSSVLELPSAILILLFFVFFPMLSVIGLGIKYGACASLNGLQLHEAALIPRSQATAGNGSVCHRIPDEWSKGGLGVFVNPTVPPTTEVSYRDGEKTATGVDKLVTVKTTVSLPPFVALPFLPNIPGLSAPLSVTIEGERPLENPFNYDS